jgi:Family of unknown function (DUF5681)
MHAKTRRLNKSTAISDEEYRVGPGRPPKEFQFKPGQSGNPKGVRRQTPNLRLLLQRELAKKKLIKRSNGEEIVQSMSAAGIEKLVADFANGCRHARRDLLILAEQVGVDLAVGGVIADALNTALSPDDQAIVDDYFNRRLADHEQNLRDSTDPAVQRAIAESW